MSPAAGKPITIRFGLGFLDSGKHYMMLRNMESDAGTLDASLETGDGAMESTPAATEPSRHPSSTPSMSYGRGRRKSTEAYEERLALRLQRYIDACNMLPPDLQLFQKYVDNLPEGKRTIEGFVEAMYMWGLLRKNGSIAKATKLTGVGPFSG